MDSTRQRPFFFFFFFSVMTRYISEFTGVRDIYIILQLGRQVVYLSSRKTMLLIWKQLIINHVIPLKTKENVKFITPTPHMRVDLRD
jgi:TRAP-type C4-dicarboxylate transport system permease small subunit